MSIDVKEVIKLIKAAHEMIEKLPPEEQFVHASDIADTLQKLVDDAAPKTESYNTASTPEYKEWGC